MAAANWHFSANMCPRKSSNKISNPTECIVTKKYLFFVTKSPNKTDQNGKFGLWALFLQSFIGAYIHIHQPIEQKQLLGKNQIKLWTGDNDNDSDIDYDN